MLVACVVVACSGGSSSTPADGGACGDGTSHCGKGGSVTCVRGQYCDRASYLTCLDGCYTNDNCACGETCVYVDGGSVGICEKS